MSDSYYNFECLYMVPTFLLVTSPSPSCGSIVSDGSVEVFSLPSFSFLVKQFWWSSHRLETSGFSYPWRQDFVIRSPYPLSLLSYHIRMYIELMLTLSLGDSGFRLIILPKLISLL